MNKSLLVLGAQWGDEGKGKITNYFSEKADLIIRYQGGDNAGHTIKFSGNTYKLHLIPSGIFNSSALNILANGMVINPLALVEEIKTLQKLGYSCNNLIISDRAHVIFTYHQVLDGLNEEALKDKKIGTTKKGIGPAYVDKCARIGMRMVDLLASDFKDHYQRILEIKNQQISNMNGTPIDFESSYYEYQQAIEVLRPFIKDTTYIIHDALKNKKKVLFEGAQGALLDIDFGTYPYVTSSNPTAGGALTGSGCGIKNISHILGIVKAYSTRVGEGAFPTEINNQLAITIREKGNEYGTTTKRPRRIGYLDLVALNYSVMISNISSLCLTLFDVLSNIDKLKICVSYKLDGKIIKEFPSSDEILKKCKPIYKSLKGWNEDISNVKTFDELPVNAKRYIKYIERYLKIKISCFSVGPDKEQTIIRKEIF